MTRRIRDVNGPNDNPTVDTLTATTSVVIGSSTMTETELNKLDQASNATDIGAAATVTGTLATIDANSTIDVTGTITVIGVMMGDD